MQPRALILLRAIATGCVLLGLLASRLAAQSAPTSSDERLERLEQKVDALNASVERLRLLLEGNAGAPITTAKKPTVPVLAATASATTAAAESDQPRPAALASPTRPGTTLDLWLRPPGYRGGVPGTPSLVTLRDDRAPLFHLGRHEKEPEMAGNTGKALVHVWRGHLRIANAGTHVLIADFQRKKDRQVAPGRKWDDYQFTWAARLVVGGKTLLDERNRFVNAGRGTLSRTFTLELEAGDYPVEIVSWMPDQEDDEEYYFRPLTFVLRLREPGREKPRELGPADFVCAD